MRRRVLTYNSTSLSNAARRLQQLVESTGYAPDCVLSIRRGGEEVGKLMFDKTAHESTCLQRPGSRAKGRSFSKLLKYLPRPVLDRLRIAEAWYLSRRSPRCVDPAAVMLPELGRYERILIIDDAVDSGATLRAVRDAVKLRYPVADVLTAVITVTTRRPVILPDFSLYNNLTLIRFPWSADSQQNKE